VTMCGQTNEYDVELDTDLGTRSVMLLLRSHFHRLTESRYRDTGGARRLCRVEPVALLGEPAVARFSQSVITFENWYMIRTPDLPVCVRRKGVFHPKRESAGEILAKQVPGNFLV